MSQIKYLPQIQQAIGAAYLLRQTAGSEMFGGLEVVLRVPARSPGDIRVSKTTWPDGEVREDLYGYETQAIEGLKAYAKARDIDLSRVDVELRRFLFHPVDSKPKAYYLAAQNALEAALNMWDRRVPVEE